MEVHLFETYGLYFSKSIHRVELRLFFLSSLQFAVSRRNKMPKQIKYFAAVQGSEFEFSFSKSFLPNCEWRATLWLWLGRSGVVGIICLLPLRSSKSTRQRRSEKKYYLQFTSGNGFYLHFSKWFVAHWGMGLLNLSLVCPEAGDPWSMNAAHGVGRQARKHSFRKVLSRLGRLGTRVKQRTAMPGFSQSNCDLYFFPPLEQTYPFYITTLELP